VPVSGDGTVVFLESAMRRAKPVTAHFWAATIMYETLQREAALPAMVWVAWTLWFAASHVRNRYRARAGHCSRCGYDLRASKDRCPECGKPIISTPA